MSFITVEKLSGFPCYTLLSCEASTFYLTNSYNFCIPSHSSELILKARSLSFQQNLLIICYDSGSMNYAACAYWVLRAVGYKNAKVLYGGLKAVGDSVEIELTSKEPEELPFTERLLPFNTELVMDKNDFIRKSTSDYLNICANFTFHDMFEENKNLSQAFVAKYLEKYEVKYSHNDKIIIFGEFSCFLGLILNYLNQNNITVVLEDFYKVTSMAKSRTVSNTTGYVSVSECESEEVFRFKEIGNVKHLESFEKVQKNYEMLTIRPVSSDRNSEDGHVANGVCNGACHKCQLL